MTTAGRPQGSSFLAAAAGTYGANVGVAALSLVNVLVISRTLGPSGRGNVAFLTTIGTLVSYLFNMGIQQSNSNLGAANSELRGRLATNSLLFALVLGGLSAIVVEGAVAIVPGLAGPSTTGLRLVALASVPVLMLQMFLSNLLQAGYRFLVTNVAWLISPVTNVVVNGALALTGDLTVKWAIVTWVGGWGITVALLLGEVVRSGFGFGRPDLPLARRSLTFGLKAHLGRIMLVGNYRSDQWFVGAIAGSRELGLYSVAVAWSELLFFLPTALASVQRPDLVRGTRQEAGRLAALVFRLTMIATAVLAVGLVVAAPVLCAGIFGADFAGATGMLYLLAPSGFGIVAMKLLGVTLTAKGMPMLETAGICIGFALSIVLDIVLVPLAGGTGASIASTLSYTGGGIALALIFLRALRVPAVELAPRRGDIAVAARHLRALRRVTAQT